MMREVRAAKITARKKTMEMSRPPGMEFNTLGRKINIRPGPLLFSCCPATAMAGMMTRAASMAAKVSKMATIRASAGTLEFRLR